MSPPAAHAEPTTPLPSRAQQRLARASPLIAGLIMLIGSFGLFIGSPLAWLWIGSQVEGSSSIGTALIVMAFGFVLTVWCIAALLGRLSTIHRMSMVAKGLPDPGHVMLEGVLVVSAALSLAAFGVWFLVFAGANPAPIGITL